ncbi:hypothetical protein TIFTF001_020148 [Ficus carica]|uniref:Uncharacterized protein n=1 Tax=Ficus carica TaxID=3494 RepID=A0AA88ATQ3_FICCA|nr:hypothetical protein TIFTF001_020148 [Ficus carica]
MMSELLSQIEAMFSAESEKPDIIAFTAWNGIFNDIDFGWGKPFWIGAMGKVGRLSETSSFSLIHSGVKELKPGLLWRKSK